MVTKSGFIGHMEIVVTEKGPPLIVTKLEMVVKRRLSLKGCVVTKKTPLCREPHPQLWDKPCTYVASQPYVYYTVQPKLRHMHNWQLNS